VVRAVPDGVPVVERVGRSLAGRLKVVKLNTDEAPDIAARYEAQGIPRLVLIDDGRDIDRLVGAVPSRGLPLTGAARRRRRQRPGERPVRRAPST